MVFKDLYGFIRNIILGNESGASEAFEWLDKIFGWEA